MSAPTPRTDEARRIDNGDTRPLLDEMETLERELATERAKLAGVIEIKRGVEAELAEMKRMLSSEKLMYKLANDSAIKHEWAAGELRNELATERDKVLVLKLDKDRLDWWNGESYYQFGKSHKCMNPGWWWSCGFDQIQGKSGIKNIRDAIDSAMAHSKSGRNKYNVCKRIEESEKEETK